MKQKFLKSLLIFTASAAFAYTSCTATAGAYDDDEDEDSSSTKTSIPTDTTTASGSSFTSSSTIYINVETPSYSLSSADDSAAVQITTKKDKNIGTSLGDDVNIKIATTDYADEESSTGVIKLDLSDSTKSYSVYLTGTMTSGGVKIQTNPDYEVGVYLNGVSITSSDYPCLEITKGAAATVFLVSGTQNTFTDGREYSTGYGEEYSTSSSDTYEDDEGNSVACTVVSSAQRDGSDAKGTLFCKGSMTICGTGSLKITQEYKNCVASKSILKLENGTLDLTSTGKCGLYGDYGVEISGGSVTYSGSGAVSSSSYHKAHGINVDDDTYSDAYVKISGGTLDFTISYGKGITAPVVDISGGTNTIKITSPTTKILDTSASYTNADGESKSETISFAPIGIDGESSVTVSGGSTTITSPWSSINSNDSVTVSSGTLTLTSSGNGLYDSSESDYTAPSCIKADGNIVVKGGTITGKASGNGSKGIKAGGNYTQSNGYVNVSATGSDLGSSSSSYGFGSSSSSSASSAAKGVRIAGAITVSGGKLYASSTGNEAIESKSTLTITGGEVYGYSTADDAINSSSTMTISGGYVCGYSSANDGLDANGNMYIKGGLVYAVCTSQPEVALDANTEDGYKLYISGGTVITVGPIESGSSLSQNCYKASSWSANTTYGVTVGSTTYVFTTPSSTSGYGSGIILSASSKPTLTSGASTSGGTSYFDGKLYVGGTKGSSSVSLSTYSSSSSSSGGPGGQH